MNYYQKRGNFSTTKKSFKSWIAVWCVRFKISRKSEVFFGSIGIEMYVASSMLHYYITRTRKCILIIFQAILSFGLTHLTGVNWNIWFRCSRRSETYASVFGETLKELYPPVIVSSVRPYLVPLRMAWPCNNELLPTGRIYSQNRHGGIINSPSSKNGE